VTDVRGDLIKRIEGHLAKTGKTEGFFCMNAAKDPAFLWKLRKGNGTTLTKIEAVYAYMEREELHLMVG